MITGNKMVGEIAAELTEISLPNMASALQTIYRSDDYNKMDHLAFLNAIVTPEYDAKMEKRLSNRLDNANLKGCPQEISKCVNSADREYKPDGITDTLRTLDFIDTGLNVCILGPSDSGKSYLAKALAIHACTRFSVEYYHCEALLESMQALKIASYNKFQKRMTQLTKRGLLVLDDFLLHTISEEGEVKILFELLERRLELHNSTIICSQREPKSWTSMIYNDEVAANALMKRVTKHYTVVIIPHSS